MTDKEQERYQVVVHNKIKDGYRRAGFALQKGPNLLMDVTQAQINELKSDPRLTFGSQDPMPKESIADAEKRRKQGELTVDQIKAKLTEYGVEFDKNAKKADLLTALEAAEKAKEKEEGKE